MPKVYSYVRFSSTEQAKGDSLRRQLEDARKYAEKKGLPLDESLTLKDLGVSAYHGTNVEEGALGGFLKAVEDGRIEPESVLVVERVDRLSRMNPWWALDVLGRLIRGGITIATVNPEREYTATDSNPMAILELVFHSAQAHEESKKKSERIAAVWSKKRKEATESGRPMTTVCPRWLRYEDGKFVPVAEKVAAVKKVFALARGGHGVDSIVRRLVEDGVPALGRSGRWNAAYVYLLLSDRRVIGEYQPKRKSRSRTDPRTPTGDPIPGYYPAVVSEAAYYAAQKALGDRRGRGGRKSTGETNVLSGLVWCYEDGHKMYFARRGKYRYLVSSATDYGRGSYSQSFGYVPLERCVLGCLSEIKLEEQNPTEDKTEEIKGRLMEARAKIEKVKAKMVSAGEMDVLLDLLVQFKDEAAKLEADLEAAKAEATSRPSEVVSLIRQRERTRGEKKDDIGLRLQSRIREVVESIWVHVEVLNRVKKVAHVQIYFRDGRRISRMTQWPPPAPDSPPPKDYSRLDFRAKWKVSGCK